MVETWDIIVDIMLKSHKKIYKKENLKYFMYTDISV